MNHKIFKLLLAISIALLIQIPVLAQSDDFPSDTTTSGQVDVNGSTTGEIETARDIDWFAVDLAADKTYTIDIEGEDTNAGTLRNPILRRIYDADGDAISGTRKSRGGKRRNPRLIFTAEQTATYYIAARGRRTLTGTYTVRVTDSTAVPEKEKARGTSAKPPPGSWTRDSMSEPVGGDLTANNTTTGKLDVGGYVTGELKDKDDVDGFKIDLATGNRYRIDVWVNATLDFGKGGSYGGPPGEDGTKGFPTLSVVNSDGTDSANSDLKQLNGKGGASKNVADASGNVASKGGGPVKGARVEFDVETTGTYLIKVTADSSYTANGGKGTYTVLAANITSEQDYNGDFSSGQNSGRLKIDDSNAMMGTIGGGGSYSDWYMVLLEEDKCYEVEAKASASGNGTLGDPEIRLMKFYDYYYYHSLGIEYPFDPGDDTFYYETVYMDPEKFDNIGSADSRCFTITPSDVTDSRTFCSSYDDDNSGTGDDAKIEVEVKTGGGGDYLIGMSASDGSVGTYSMFAGEITCPD